MARSTKAQKKSSSEVVADTEIDELETIDDLEDLEDLDEFEDEEEEDADEEEEDEEPEDLVEEQEDEEEEEEEKPRRRTETKKSQAARDGYVGTAEVATHVGVDSRTLRMLLRKLRQTDDAFAPDEDTGRYQWPSLNSPAVKKIRRAVDRGAATGLKKESLDRLKETKAKKKVTADTDARAKTSKRKAKTSARKGSKKRS